MATGYMHPNPPMRAVTAPTATLAPGLADRIRDLIAAGVYPPGSPIRQEDVAARLGVSRIPLREVFRLLEADGIVTILANRGAFVRQQSVEEIDELFDVRVLLEGDLIARAAGRMTAERVGEIERIEQRLARAVTAAAWVRLDTEFHQAIYEHANRPQTLALASSLRRALNAYHVRYLGPRVRATAWRTEHRGLIRALRARDARQCRQLLVRHLRRTTSPRRKRVADVIRYVPCTKQRRVRGQAPQRLLPRPPVVPPPGPRCLRTHREARLARCGRRTRSTKNGSVGAACSAWSGGLHAEEREVALLIRALIGR